MLYYILYLDRGRNILDCIVFNIQTCLHLFQKKASNFSFVLLLIIFLILVYRSNCYLIKTQVMNLRYFSKT